MIRNKIVYRWKIYTNYTNTYLYIYIFIRTYFLQSSTQKMQLYTNRIYEKIIILLKYMNKMNSDMSEN